MFYDLQIHGNHKLALDARKMGYSGVALVLNSMDYKNKSAIIQDIQSTKSHFQDDPQFQIKIGLKIQAKNPTDLKKQVRKFRDRVDVILVHGGDLKINRAATEDPRIDILSHPYSKRYDSGINHVLAFKAAENKVSIEINIKYFLLTRPNQRHLVLSQFRQIVKLHRKYKFPIIITSDADSLYDLRHPRDVMALASCFGMTSDESMNSLSSTPLEILARNDVRKSTVLPGVRLIKNDG